MAQKITPKWFCFFFRFIWADKTFKTACGIFFWINQPRNTLNLGNFTVKKIALHNKVVNKTQTKDQENSVHRFGENYLTNVVKSCSPGLSPKELEHLDCALVKYFSRKSLVWALKLPLTYRVTHVNHIKGTLMLIWKSIIIFIFIWK